MATRQVERNLPDAELIALQELALRCWPDVIDALVELGGEQRGFRFVDHAAIV